MNLTLALIKLHYAILQRKQRIVLAASHIHTRMKTGSQLTNQNAARAHPLATKTLYAPTLRVTIATIT